MFDAKFGVWGRPIGPRVIEVSASSYGAAWDIQINLRSNGVMGYTPVLVFPDGSEVAEFCALKGVKMLFPGAQFIPLTDIKVGETPRGLTEIGIVLKWVD